MPTPTTHRRTNTAYHNRTTQGYIGNQRQPRYDSAERVYDYPYTYPYQRPMQTPRPQARPQEAARQVKSEASVKKPAKYIRRTRLRKILSTVAVVAGMCMLMLYRYSAILENSNRISELEAEIAAIDAGNQAMQAKIDRGLELGTLEEYATSQLGMIRPDSAQMFYIDMQMADETQEGQEAAEGEKTNALKGAPGALVHAIQVLK